MSLTNLCSCALIKDHKIRQIINDLCLLFLRIMNLASFSLRYNILIYFFVRIYIAPLPPPPLYSEYGNLSLQYGTYLLQCETSLYIVWDIYLYIMGHLSLQYGTSIYTVWDIYHYSMGHTVCISLWDIYIYTVWDVTSIYSVWDIYLFSMGHISMQYGASIVWDIYVFSMDISPHSM